MKYTAPIFAASIAVTLSGCANIMSRSSVVAPEWFESKAAEVKGEGYPKLADVPKYRPNRPADEWDRDADALRAEAASVVEIPTDGEALLTPEEIRARAAQLRAEVAEGEEAPAP